MSFLRHACFGLSLACLGQSQTRTCPGSIFMEGHGRVALVNAEFNIPADKAGEVEVDSGSRIVSQLKGRTYFAEECSTGNYSNTQYMALKLLGKRMKYIVDLSGAGCGCNAALSLHSLPQNPLASDCLDYFCDANNVCGVACAEIDIQQANEHAWHSTLHAWDDRFGVAAGYGGNQARDWTAFEYGPGGDCIDTSKPFDVAVSFPVNEYGSLAGMEVFLSQHGHSCPLLTHIYWYQINGRDGLADMTKALADGMTPTISYWSSNDMLWMDGLGPDYQGPCHNDNATSCGESVKFYDFAVEVLTPQCKERCPVGHCDTHGDKAGVCEWFANDADGMASYHCKVESCDDVPNKSGTISSCWSWQGEHFYSIRDPNFHCQDNVHHQMEAKGHKPEGSAVHHQMEAKGHKPEGSAQEHRNEEDAHVVHLVLLIVAVGGVIAAVLCRAVSKLRRSTVEEITSQQQERQEQQCSPSSSSNLHPMQASMKIMASKATLPQAAPRERLGTLPQVSSRELLLLAETGEA